MAKGKNDKQRSKKYYTENKWSSNTWHLTLMWCRCSGRVSNSCSTSDTLHATVKRHEHHLIWKSCLDTRIVAVLTLQGQSLHLRMQPWMTQISNQGFLKNRLILSFKLFPERYQHLVDKYYVPLKMVLTIRFWLLEFSTIVSLSCLVMALCTI